MLFWDQKCAKQGAFLLWLSYGIHHMVWKFCQILQLQQLWLILPKPFGVQAMDLNIQPLCSWYNCHNTQLNMLRVLWEDSHISAIAFTADPKERELWKKIWREQGIIIDVVKSDIVSWDAFENSDGMLWVPFAGWPTLCIWCHLQGVTFSSCKPVSPCTRITGLLYNLRKFFQSKYVLCSSSFYSHLLCLDLHHFHFSC